MNSFGTDVTNIAGPIRINLSDKFEKNMIKVQTQDDSEKLGDIQALEKYFESTSYTFDTSTLIWVLKYALGITAFLEILSFALPYLFLADIEGEDGYIEKQGKKQVDEEDLSPPINPNAIWFRLFMSWLIFSYAVIYAWKNKALKLRECKALPVRRNTSLFQEESMEGKFRRRNALTLQHIKQKSDRKRKEREKGANAIAWSISFSFLLYGYILLKIRDIDMKNTFGEKNILTDSFQHEKMAEGIGEVQSSSETENKTALSISQWAEDLKPALATIFSCLWFVNSFVKASFERRSTVQKREKKLILKHCPEKNNKRYTKKQARRSAFTRQRSIQDAEELSSAVGYSSHIFAWALFCQLSLLPVKFYIILFSFLENLIFRGEATCKVIENELVQQCSNAGGLNDMAMNFFTKEETKYCLGYVIFLRASSLVSFKLRSNIAASVKTLKMRIVRYAIRRPIQRVRKLRRTLRWIKYLTPLVLKTRKLGANFRELLKRRKQRFIRKRAESERRKRRSTITDMHELEEDSAMVIQANYRSYKSRKSTRILRLLTMTESETAVFKIGCRMRAWAKRAKARILEKEKEWRQLKLKQIDSDLSFDEKKRMYQLETQVQKDVKIKTQQRMLLRTNTKFAVVWKLIFLVGVLVEISYITLEPKVRKYKNISSNEKLDVDTVLEYYLVPELIGEWPECSTDPTKRQKRRMRIFRWAGRLRRKKKNLDETINAWYCFTPYTTVQSMYIDFVQFMIGEALYVIGVIFFMDVFINFFTGDVCPKTGEVKPRHFFKRWIIPGIAFQLLLNPWMADVRVVVNMVWRLINHVGPARLWRWCVVLIFPCTRAIARWLKWNVYYELVAAQNKDIGFKAIEL